MRISHLILVLLLPAALPAQFPPNYVFLEHFTNTRCVLCPGPNALLHQTLAANAGKVHAMSVHPNVPYADCQLYQHNTADNLARKNRYGVSSTPDAFLNGQRSRQGTTLLPSATLQAALALSPALGLRLSEAPAANGRSVSVSLRSYASTGADSLRLFVAVVEDTVFYTGPNGEPQHYNVLRKLLSGPDGLKITQPPLGGSQAFTFSYDFHPAWDTGRVFALAFVQDKESRKIFGSGTPFDLRLSVSASGSSALAEASGGIPPYTYQWDDPAAQSSPEALNLAPGLYRVTVSDAAGISAQDSVRISGSTALGTGLESLLQVYPSPASQGWFLAVQSPAPLRAQVLDLQGRAQTERFPLSSEAFWLDATTWSSGIYILRIEDAQGLVLSRKLLLAPSGR